MSAPSTQASGLVQFRSHHPPAVTLDRLEALLRARGVLIFARIDFSGDAARAGLSLPAEQLLIFGNPKAGTPLMRAVPISGLDLPLKALAWEDAEGHSWIGYNAPDYVVRRHGLDGALAANLAAVNPLIEQAAAEP